MLRLGVLTLAALLCTPAFAGLLDKHFPDKSEADVTAEFEAGMGNFLEARLGEPLKPRIWYQAGRESLWLEVVEVNEVESSWQVLGKNGSWYSELKRYVYVPYGKIYKFKTADIPPAEVASWYVSKHRLPQEMIALACWLAGKEALTEANQVLSDLATNKTDFRADVEAWLCEKNGWTLTEDGLQLFETYDLERDRAAKLLLTENAANERLELLDKEAKKAFKELEELQGGDVKSKPGYRRGEPKMRLETLQDYVNNFAVRYAGTPFMEKKSTKKDMAKLLEAIQADLDWIEAEVFKAERLGIEDNWPEAAKAYDLLLRADPYNQVLMQRTADAWNKAAVVTDGARKAEDKAAAKNAAVIYERMCEEFPVVLRYRNHAGVNRLASGDAKKAKEHHEEVVRLTEGRELNEIEQQDRDFAERQLKLIG